MSEYKASCYALRWVVRAAKLRYRERIESHFQLNDSRRMWQGLKTICSSGNKSSADLLLAKELNNFYGHFECKGGSVTLPISVSGSSRQSSDDHVITVSEDEVWREESERQESSRTWWDYISVDLTWTAHIQTPVKKAMKRLYHLRQLRKTRVSPDILKTLYSGAIENVLTQCISVWHGNASNQDCKALQRVVRLAERISGSALPSLQDIYLKCCKSRAAKITKDSNHPGNHLFILLPSGKCFRSMMAKT